ncbi:MAG: Fe-S cluster assembly protein SufD [Gammaproteobacteria bacterium]|nr:Fe-S cluster assembly protein SufD [Gammaproteobacteria bacterium]
MIQTKQQQDWLQKIITQAKSHDINCNSILLNKIHSKARQAVMQYPTLTRKQEEWRYNHIDKLFDKNFKLSSGDINLHTIHIHHYLLPSLDTHRLFFVNGRYTTQWSTPFETHDKTNIGCLRDAINQEPKKMIKSISHFNNNELFSDLNMALMDDGAVIHIGDQTKIDKPIEIIYLNINNLNHFDNEINDGITTHCRNIISIGVGSETTIIERFIGENNDQYFHNNHSNIHLDKGAKLKHYRVQEDSQKAFHLSSLSISQQQNSHYESSFISFDSAWSKTNINVDFQGENASCLINGFCVVGNQQITDFHIDVQHNVPSCVSKEHFKSIVYGKGRSVFDGHILVEKQAQHSDAQLKNNNLMLTQDAEVDTKPQLEIYANDVKCSHGTTIGQLDPEQLFYMRSRGLSNTTAYRLLCLGFADEIIKNIDEKKISEHVSKKLVLTLDKQDFH